MDQQTLCRNDVWIFQAMDARKGYQSSLIQIISHADAVNHSIPSYGGLCHAVSILSALGLIVASHEKCEVTDSGRAVLSACHRRNFMDENERIAEHLGAGPWESIAWGNEPPQEQRFVSREHYEKVVYEYVRRF